METASPVGSKRAATGGHEAKLKAPKKMLPKEEKGVQSVNRRGWRKNPKERNAEAVEA
jgi:hypothetical protein